MMDYLYILSEFDWCKDKINSEADYFEAIYEDIYEHVQTISNLSKIYLLLSNLMISQTYIDRENFMRKSLITVTEYLVFP